MSKLCADVEVHLLYQQVFSRIKALKKICNVFERVLIEKCDWDVESQKKIAQEQYQEDVDWNSCECRYQSLLFQRFFECFDFTLVSQYINLGVKEYLAHRMDRCLNLGEESPNTLRELLREFSNIPIGNLHVSTRITMGIRVDLISQYISDRLPFIGIAKNYINLRDIEKVLSRSVGSLNHPGLIGGKAAGFVLANAIVKPTIGEIDLDLDKYIERTDSYYIKSCVAVEFTSENGLEDCHSIKYYEGEEIDIIQEGLEERFLQGQFSEHIIAKFHQILEETEGSPLIVRSSSYLEDGVGSAFSGKYDSFFISNCGSMRERLEELCTGIKRIYLSLYSVSAIEYRRDRSLLDYNERMAVLVQKVVGNQYGKYFFPAIGIVGFSRNSYCWNDRIKPEDGMLRMVMGLGTRAVDRVGDDYPRMVSLSEPSLRPESTRSEQMRCSQRYIDVLNLETRQVETHHFVDLINEIKQAGHKINLKDIISIVEEDMLKTPLIFPAKLEHGKCSITFDKLFKKVFFTALLKRVLRKVEDAYGMPVDMEFAYNNEKLYILQCRHLSQRNIYEGKVSIPEVSADNILFKVNRSFDSIVLGPLNWIVYIDEAQYEQLNQSDKRYEVARIIGRINRNLNKEKFVLMGPGRWGSSNINLGVPVRYGDINNSAILIEIAYQKDGITPELSHGTHFFQDLVEANIIPLPIYPDEEGGCLNRDFLKNSDNYLAALLPEDKAMEHIVRIINLSSQNKKLMVYLDAQTKEGLGCLMQST